MVQIVPHIPIKTGELADLPKFMENSNGSVRQSFHLVFDLSDVCITTETIVYRILFEKTPTQKLRATSVVVRMIVELRLDQLQCFFASSLQLFWIYQQLAKISLTLCIFPTWAFSWAFELSGVAVLKTNLMCIDWFFNTALPIKTLEKALPEDRELLDVMRLGEACRIYIQIMILHNSLAPSVPVDGSFVGTSVMLILPTP
ncbi:uncharacterized protein EAE97_006330 [Botrytis byssoidea]|uniref:Uncharacterized protein n=1 Tax=Botrytis byssoidea TaxID=139641 RepID=A0A9P5ILA2_9HELO|nr:uncharacterized protein EAE97_006330 [Botrytis byssoidea]KAF7942876.1 hypothetical protein EAE97_006330 [Botrytis byssoidea]